MTGFVGGVAGSEDMFPPPRFVLFFQDYLSSYGKICTGNIFLHFNI